jgi:hypothetical protein
MRRLSKWVLGLALLAGPEAWAADAETGPFDGHWSITLVCPASPDGGRPFRFDFFGSINANVLHGENGPRNQPGWMTLDGQVQPSGDAELTARGMTGSALYTINHAEKGVPYTHAVTAHFDGGQGIGHWFTTRTCDFTFRKL